MLIPFNRQFCVLFILISEKNFTLNMMILKFLNSIFELKKSAMY